MRLLVRTCPVSLLSLGRSIHGDGVPAQVIRGGHPLPAGGLQDVDAQHRARHRRQRSGPSYPPPGHVPGAFPVVSSSTAVAKILHFTPSSSAVADGPGDEAPHLVVECPGGLGPVHGRQLPAEHGGQRDLALRPGGCGWRCRRRCSATVSTSRSAPRRARRSWSVSTVSSGSMGVATWAMMSPASRSSAMCMMVTPVSLSPLRMAQWMGAAPRYLGSREEWTLMQPYLGAVQDLLGQDACRRRPPR